MSITPHANGEPLFLSHLQDTACCLLQTAMVMLLLSRLVPIFILTDTFVQVIVSSIRTNRARCALYKKILDLLDEESVPRESSGRASLSIRREVLLRMFKRMSQSLKFDSIFLGSTHTYIYNRKTIY